MREEFGGWQGWGSMESSNQEAGIRNQELPTSLVSGIWALASSLIMLEVGLEVWNHPIRNQKLGIRNLKG